MKVFKGYASCFYSLIHLMIAVVLTCMLGFIVWKIFIYQERATAADYQLLANISPEEVIFWQKNKPNFWKDYVAVNESVKYFTNKEKGFQREAQTFIRSLFYQLDQNIGLESLKWTGINKDLRKRAIYIRKVLDKYPIYTPGEYQFPLKEACYYEDTFGADREGGKRTHQGTDLFNKKGTPIFSVCEGTVERLGWNRLGGERVGVRGKDGNYYYYAHLDQMNPHLWVGKRIDKGEFIGTMGNTGDALTTPDHLHFGIELSNGEWINPYPFIKVWEFHQEKESTIIK